MKWLGFIKNDHYHAGHAAFLLVRHKTGNVEYFDFGRYHTPHQYGRVRDQFTDPDIAIKLKAHVVDGEIQNLESLLKDRYNNKACHGDGRLIAAICQDICYDTAYAKAKELQQREAIPYGPFTLSGSTCSRLVAQVVYPSTSCRMTKAMIKFPYTISATPRSNNKVLNHLPYYFEVSESGLKILPNKFYPLRQLFKSRKSATKKPSLVAETSY